MRGLGLDLIWLDSLRLTFSMSRSLSSLAVYYIMMMIMTSRIDRGKKQYVIGYGRDISWARLRLEKIMRAVDCWYYQWLRCTSWLPRIEESLCISCPLVLWRSWRIVRGTSCLEYCYCIHYVVSSQCRGRVNWGVLPNKVTIFDFWLCPRTERTSGSVIAYLQYL
jgi:hypothetical protein